MFNLFSRFLLSSYRTFQTLTFTSSTHQFSAISNSLIMADQKDEKTLGSGNNGAAGKSNSPVADKKGEAGKGGNQFSTQRVTRQEALELEKSLFFIDNIEIQTYGAFCKERFLNMPLGEKRKFYQCKDKYSVLADVPKWDEYFKENQARLLNKWKGKKFQTTYTTNQKINQKVAIWRGDITRIEIDAIVNAANNSLLGGGGVDGAIHRAAGKLLVGECKGLNGCDSGDAKITGGYKLPAKYVIHTVGPIGEKPWLLQSAYSKSLDLVKQEQLTSVAFPCISTGIYGYPNLKAAHLAMEHVRKFLEDEEVAKTIDCIVFCLFLPTDVDIYETFMQVYFPVDGDDTRTQPTTGENNKKETENQVSGDEKAGEEVNGDAAATNVVKNDPDTKENGKKAETQRSGVDLKEKEGSEEIGEKLEDKLDHATGSSVEETVTHTGETKKAKIDSEVTCKDGEGKTSTENLGQGVVKEETDDLKDMFMESAAAQNVEEVKVGSEEAIKDIKADCLRDEEEVGNRTVGEVEGGQGECEFDNSRGEDDSPQSKKKALVQDTKL